MHAVAITGIICITLNLITMIPLWIAWSAEKSIKELIFGPIVHEHRFVVINENDSKYEK